MLISAVINTDVKLSCLIDDGSTNLYPQATITKPDSTTFISNLLHIAQGRYEATVTGGNFSATGMYFCVYIPYTDALHTATAVNYSFSMDQYLLSTSDLSGLNTLIARVLGLEHDNSLIDSTQYDSCNQLITARIRVFDSAANLSLAVVDEPVTSTPGLLNSYTAVTTYDGPGKMGSYRLIRTL